MLANVIPGTVSWTIFFLVSGLNVLVGVTLQLITLPFDRTRKTSLWVDHWFWGRMLWACEPMWHFHPSGLSNIGPGPYVIIANHQSVLDIPAVMHLPMPIRVMGKSSLFRVPVMGSYMRFSRQIEVPTHAPPTRVQQVLDEITQHLNAGVSVLIFPEGTRSADGSLGTFHRGAFRISKDLDVPIVPIAIRGTERILAKGTLWFRLFRVNVFLRVLDPVCPAEFSTARTLSRRVRSVIGNALEELDAQ